MITTNTLYCHICEEPIEDSDEECDEEGETICLSCWEELHE